MSIRPTNMYLIRVLKPIKDLDPMYYEQYASLYGDEFIVTNSDDKEIKIKLTDVKILAQNIMYFD